jgi:membrane-bound serine protease (ClpP class)
MLKLKSSLATFLLLGMIIIPQATLAQSGGEAVVLSLEGPLTPAMSSYLRRGLSMAQQEAAEVVIVTLNTPGGAIDLMSEMVATIRASQVPVVIYVSPRGAIAGSAGTVITVAAHVAAMAPETSIGAASPVDAQGQDIGETLAAKQKNILKAQIRSLTEGRPPGAVSAAEDTIQNASALTSSEAYDIGLIDIIATDLPDLLRQLDGRVVTTAGGEQTLNTQFLEINEVNQTVLEELLNILTNPNIVFLLLTIGVQAVLIEIGSPGGWIAGTLGVTCLALAAYGLGILPVNYFGLIFLITAFVLFFLEIKAPVHGALVTVGIVFFVIGALVLFNSSETPPNLRVSVPLVIGTGLFTAASFITVLTFALRAQRAPVRMGQSSLIGKSGVVKTDIPLHGQGEVQLTSELWTAELAEGEDKIKSGQRVEVVEVEGLRLKVKKKD